VALLGARDAWRGLVGELEVEFFEEDFLVGLGLGVAAEDAFVFASEARLRPSKRCPGVSVLPAFPYLLLVPRYGTFRNEKFFRILEGENEKRERMKL